MPALHTCIACPRLAAFVAEARADHPDWHAAPVPPWGDPRASILILGLAPGYRGANRTGRPFNGDRSGAWVYRAIFEAGLAENPDPTLAGGRLMGARITNAVKCVPPQNKPTGVEIATCRGLWLAGELADPAVRVLVALGGVAHQAVVDSLGLRRAAHPFAHAAEHALPGGRALLDSYHPSPHNSSTGRLSWEAFLGVFQRATALGRAAG
ncbi:MAG: uracil-DNA glycosylase [Pseudomonadota bacterium]